MSSPVRFRPARSPLLEFILHFSTLGIYSCFWFYYVVREFKYITQRSLTPFMWFFVPWFFLAQLLALPTWFNELQTTEKQLRLKPKWPSVVNVLWAASFICATLFLLVAQYVEFPEIYWLSVLIFTATLMSLLQLRINPIRETVQDVEFISRYKGFSFFEWCYLFLSVPFILFIVYTILSTASILTDIEAVEADSEYVDTEKAYKVAVSQTQWKRVKIGTYSDGTALEELKGPANDMYFLIFNNGENQTLNSMAQWRISQVYDEVSNPQCTEQREYVPSTLNVKAEVVCTGTVLGDSILITSTLLSIDGEIYEMYGNFSAVKYTFEQYKNEFLTMAKGFGAYDEN
ncbi:hypothetical protein [Aliiglaciecola litoralis]|uniref:DUF4234 domain-containing protein n=1 Tax=Aliiglaciecola litoralis TaxID=582857 RepID=A0ABP3WY86_9ALTE